MTRRLLVPSVVAIFFAVGTAPAAFAQEACPGGAAPLAWIGAHALHCPGGACSYYDLGQGTSGPTYDFSSEPWLRAIDTSGPGAGILEEGDVLVAVNGYLITTTRGGRELASLPAGSPAELTVRRDTRLLRLEVTPVPRCEGIMLLSGNTVVNVPLQSGTPASTDWNYEVVRPRGAGFHSGHSGIGAAFACSNCSIRFDDQDRFAWIAAGPVEVRAVAAGSAADEAGLMPGDRVVSVNGDPMHTTAAGQAFFHATAGDELRLGILRDGRSFETTVTVRGSDTVFAEGSAGAVLRRGERGWGPAAMREALEGLRTLREAYDASGPPADDAKMSFSGMTISGDSWGPSALGATFDCHDDCVWTVDNGKVRWDLREYLTVKEVERGGPAEQAGLLPGDVLLSIDGHDLMTQQAGELFAHAGGGDRLRLVVRRDGRERTLTLIAR